MALAFSFTTTNGIYGQFGGRSLGDTVSLRAIEAGDLAVRVEALEGVLSKRRQRKRAED